MAEKRSGISPIWIVAGWLVFSVALAGWWVIFAYRFLSGGLPIDFSNPASIEAKQRMLVYEGISLIVCLIAGGVALAYYVLREHKRNEQIRQFFAAFTHDLKTPIASLRLQAESLGEDLAGSGQAVLAKRLLGDTHRLELQLENSLFFANLDQLATLHLEDVRLGKIVERVKSVWPELAVSCDRDASLKADPRALEIIFKNLASNSHVHGRARSVRIDAKASGQGRVALTIEDDGSGFEGPVEGAGELFVSSGTRAGSGVGLYLVRSLARKMGGSAEFANRQDRKGFRAAFDFAGRIL